MAKSDIARIRYGNGYASDLPATDGNGFLRQGSKNVLVTGSGLIRPFKGVTRVSGTGGLVNFLTDDGYASLGLHGETNARGSIFQAIDHLFYIGQGGLAVNGSKILDPTVQRVADTNLSYLTRSSGNFNSASDKYQVGHAQPSTPNLYSKSPPSANQKVMNATVVVVVWRVDSLTGTTSRPSPISEVLEVNSGSVIVQFSEVADSNAQDRWGIGVVLLGITLGVLYQLPTDINGEVLESTLAYTRAITQASTTISDATLTLNASTPSADRFTSADIGRRVAISGAADSYIVNITDEFNAEMNDLATANATNQPLTITHAVDGYTRAIEISWSDDDLAGQAIAPFDAFPPPDGMFASFLNDVFYVEDTAGTIFYSIPNYLAFPRSRRIFTEDKAVVYLDSGNQYHWRIAKQSISLLHYETGETPVQLRVKTRNLGCKYPQNSCLGYNGRIMLWSGRPTLVEPSGGIDSTFYLSIASDLEGWEDQTSATPVVPAFDPIGLYELWCYGSTIYAFHAPSGRWSAPIDLTDWFTGSVVGQVIIDEELHLVVDEDGEPDLVLYKWNSGSGSDITLVSYHHDTPREDATITEIETIVKAGSSSNTLNYTLIKNFTDEISLGSDIVPSTPATQVGITFRPNIRKVKTFAIKITAVDADGYLAVDYTDVYGEWKGGFTSTRTT